MSQTSTDGTGVSYLQQCQKIVADDPTVLEAIPEPPATIHGLPATSSSYTRLANFGLFSSAGRCRGDHEQCDKGRPDCSVKVWRVSRQLYQALADYHSSLTLLECGHSPFRNVSGEAGYSCIDDCCEARYTRAEIEEVLEDGV